MCVGCHSPELRLNNGTELTEGEIDKLINENYGIDCVVFMGEGKDKESLLKFATYIKEKHNILVGVYSGRNEVEEEYFNVFDYIKIGEYKKEYGPLNKETTNQRLYRVKGNIREDITYLFWNKKTV